MKVTELKDWNKLTPEEQARLRDVYEVGADDELPESITKTMAQPTPADVEIGTPENPSTVVIHTESVVVNENEK